ncbi:MAG: roadblock/LC7 domain-containing protein [Myxococcota bacterium]
MPPPRSSVDRAKSVDAVLSSLTALRGVTAAGVIDNDGFVVQIRRDFEIDTDALGAGVQVAFGAAAKAVEQSNLGTSSLVLIESDLGLIMLVPLANEFVLAIIADRSTMLGALRYEARQVVPELNQLF